MKNRSKSEKKLLRGKGSRLKFAEIFYVDSSLYVLDAMHVVRHSDDSRRVLAPVR